MELGRFDFATDDSLTGFRLNFFEFYNWGTYHNSIVKLELDQHNGLLTGDIGSGKSTVVDAITTLLVPHQKIVYNKAAGAGAKERTIKSYILGDYKSSKDENYSSSKAVSLRDESSFSVLLGEFANEGYGEYLTLAQFFYISNSKEHKFFVVSKNRLGIREDFFDFKDIKSLKKRLRATPHTTLYESFRDYSKDFRRTMGIKNDQALNLFYQTVSLKEIGNLTSFIRTQMLEKSDIDTQIDELCKNFADLNQAHSSVLRAKRQIEMLSPIDSSGKRYEKLSKEKLYYEALREALGSYMAEIEIGLLSHRLDELNIELTKSISKRDTTNSTGEILREKEVSLKIELEKNGGDRLNAIDTEIKNSQRLIDQRREQNRVYNDIAKKLELKVASNEHTFLNNQNEVSKELEGIDKRRDYIQNEIITSSAILSQNKQKSNTLLAEISYLRANRTNIPKNVSSIRDAMAEALGLDIEELPFAGELIQVIDQSWEGAIQRVLGSFALSLLVESSHYDEVSRYVDSTDLKGRLIYLKIDANSKSKRYTEIYPNSIVNKIEIKADTKLFDTLQDMINDRFNIPCVDSIDEFKRLKRALTINGQYKSSLARHEKDDRYSINDKSRWVLGWDNQQKLNMLEEEYEIGVLKIEKLNEEITSLQKSKESLEYKRDMLRDISKYESFSQIDWYSISKAIERLEEEKKTIQESSDIIATLQTELKRVVEDIAQNSLELDSLNRQIGATQNSIQNKRDELQQAQILLDRDSIAEYKEPLDKLYARLIQSRSNLNNIKQHQRAISEHLYSRLRSFGDKLSRLGNSIVESMSLFATEYPTITKDFNASIESLGEFRAKLKELKRDDLPKWEKRFKELFREGTVQNIVMIQESLQHQERQIEQKIGEINRSLRDIEYSDSTYIELLAERSSDIEIREFRQHLKSAISGAMFDDGSIDESKFIQIRDIIDRFNGREGYSDIDKRWRSSVTDVRNWFDFSAMERYISDDSPKEYYAHSGGKSGGQKEKLAYTVLASSLAFQFGIEYGRVQSRSFRFVMIDEAFGRGSDESSRYALRLFEKLKLQLLVITPKQKINIIEPFVKSLHFVHNQDGMRSSVVSMRIDEYQKRKIS